MVKNHRSVFLLLIAVAAVAAFAGIGEAETLAGVVGEALARHPAIGAHEYSVRAAQEATKPAGTWPDPQISFGVMNVSGTNWTVGSQAMSQVSVGVSQMLPLPGKLGLSRAVAQADVGRANASLDVTKNTLAARVALAALDIRELDRTIAIDKRIRDRFDEMVRAAQGRLTVGAAMQADVVSMMLERDMADAKIADETDRRPALVARLNGLLDRPADAPFDSLAVGPLAAVPTDTAALVDTALAAQPSIAMAEASVGGAKAMSLLAAKNRLPNPMVMARYGNRGGLDGIYEIGVSFSLPVHMDARQDADVQRADDMLAVREHDVDIARLDTRTTVAALVQQLQANGRLLKTYRDSLIPRADEVVNTTYAAYGTGRTTLVRALDDIRKLDGLERAAVMIETNQRRMLVQLDQAIGDAPLIASGRARFAR